MVNKPFKLDLHIHSTISDGTDTPEELVSAVKTAGISLFSVTDHDAIKAANVLSPLLGNELRFLPGVEFSCKDEKGKYHILGYGFDPKGVAIQATVEYGHSIRMKKVLARLDFLKTKFGFSFPEEELSTLLSLNNPGKPHIGNLMVKCGFAETKEEAISKYINQIHFQNEYMRPEKAIEGILASGGVPVLAHPFYGSGNELIIGEDMENRLIRLMDVGLQGVEVFYSGVPEKLQKDALALAKRHHLYVTAGSDYHGSNKLVKLGDIGVNNDMEYPEELLRFLKLFQLL